MIYKSSGENVLQSCHFIVDKQRMMCHASVDKKNVSLEKVAVGPMDEPGFEPGASPILV